jgi:hypothetical protein
MSCRFRDGEDDEPYLRSPQRHHTIYLPSKTYLTMGERSPRVGLALHARV